MSKESRPPNLLVVHTDQQSCWTLSAYGGNEVHTPNVDRLAREGARFDQFFTNSPVCTPSRGCFVTGRYPHAHGAYRNSAELHRDEVTWASLLQRAGYATGYIGKWHLDGPGRTRGGWLRAERSMGFADCRWMFENAHWKRMIEQPDGTVRTEKEVGDPSERPDPSTYTTDFLTDKAIEFLEGHRAGPFCLMLSIPDPHMPWTVREPYASMYRAEDMRLPASLCQEDVPAWQQAMQTWRDRSPPAEQQLVREVKAQYCGEVKCIDDNVGRMLDRLDAWGISEHTAVVFTSDHGELMGEHGLMAKNALYATDCRVPLIVRWPERVRAGTVVSRVTSTVDFQPTLLSLLGVDPSGREQGADASAFLLGGEVPWRDTAFVHHSSMEHLALFTPEHELVCGREGEHALYDRLTDSEQVHNRLRDPRMRDAVRDLFALLVDHCRRVDAPELAWVQNRAGDWV